MRKSFLLILSIICFGSVFAQEEKLADVHAGLTYSPGTKPGGTATLVIKVTPKPEWHVYSLEETGAYLATKVTVGEKTTNVTVSGSAKEAGKKISEYDEVMMGNMNYFEGPATFSQNLKVTASKVHVEGLIEFQVCNGDKCVMVSEPFKVDAKVK